MPELKASLGWKYLQDTKFDRESIFASKPRIKPAPVYKVYQDASRYELPRPRENEDSLFRALASRRSRRSFSQQRAVSLQELSDLLWACQGITARAGSLGLRTAPSAGALYPVETYLLLHRVEDMPAGAYHFNVRDFCLELLSQGDFRRDMAKACINQQFMADADLDVCWTAVFRRAMGKYGHRGLRYILMDAGHICQNLLLACEVLGISACPVAAFFDGEMNSLFGLDGEEESAIYCAGVGV